MGLLFLILFLLILTFAGYLGRYWWGFKVIDFFHMQYAVLSLLVAIYANVNANYDVGAVLTVFAALNLFRIRHYIWERDEDSFEGGFKIISVNAYRKNFCPEKLGKYLEEEKPDILLVLEMTDNLRKEIKSVVSQYKYKHETPVRDGHTICLLSRHKLSKKKITKHGGHDTPLLSAIVKLANKEYQIFSAHPLAALNADYAKDRELYFSEIEKYFESHSMPVLVLGDFNSVPWEKHFMKFLKKAHLKSTLWNTSYTVTWPAVFPFMGIPMDQILVNDQIEHKGLRRGPFIGSDHYPICLTVNAK